MDGCAMTRSPTCRDSIRRRIDDTSGDRGPGDLVRRGERGVAVDDADVLLMFNADDKSHLFFVPAPAHEANWHLVIDTGLPPPQEIRPPGEEVELYPSFAYHVKPRSLVMLICPWG